ncbi:hypothetical protein JYT89_02370 [Flavobacteriaceae bacterium AH-315-B10]|nr:hypothetical protein [Flavobacteriaceae bacterium AH-315-B10]
MLFFKRFFLAAIIITVVLNSCQDSIPETIESEEEAQLKPNTNLAGLLTRTTLKDGSKDNIIDKANCITIVLPVTIIVNNIEILISNENDYQLIENAIEEFSNDDDDVLIVFPIEIILSDHTKVNIGSQDVFDNYISDCAGENVLDNDIECIDFVFPIAFDVLISNTTIPSTISITNDAELFELLENLDDYITINFSFPIALITWGGTEISVNSLESLEANLENAINDCDEDDDYDFNDDDDIILSGFLTDGNWIIDEYAFVDEDFTEDYEGYVFNFDDNMNISANNGVQLVSGNWLIDNTNPNNLLVIFNFDATAPFNVLNENWNITESQADRLALEIGSETNGDLKILVFEKL